MAAVTLDEVAKSFGATTVLESISLNIADGEFLTLLGPSGCGKSTLLRIIAGLETQDAGSVSIDGKAVDALRPKQRDVAMVFQSYALYPHLTVAENIALPLRMRRLSYWQRFPAVGRFVPGTRAIVASIADEVAQTAKALEIAHLLDRKPRQLSGGQRQRVAVGRAMVRRPHVFLMDEPLSNLDAKLRVAMRAEIKELHRRLGVTFIYVTHDQAEAMTLSDRVAVMLEGELLQVASPQEIYSDPISLKVASFVGSPQINLIGGVSRGDHVVDAAGTAVRIAARIPRDVKVKIAIRPEALGVAEHPGAGVIMGRVGLVEHHGSDLFVHVDVDGEAAPIIARIAPSVMANLSRGAALGLAPQPDAVLVFDEMGRRIRPAPPAVSPIQNRA
jgi:multiple sugar transport system ATP-binding protein